MINYKPTKWRELSGEFPAIISAVEVQGNNYFEEGKDNSTENIMNISFELEDPETFEAIPFVQKYVAPLTGGKSLFQQLLDAKEFLPDEDGGVFNEQSLVGLRLVVTMGKNKKGYAFVESVRPPIKKKPTQNTAPEAEKATVPDDLPF